MNDNLKTPILEIRDLNVTYGQSHALQGVNLKLGSGLLSLVGRNGMGKTTLCKAILGLEPVQSGTINFNGKSLVDRSTWEIAKAGIGYVPQGRRLWHSLTVDEHLRLVEQDDANWTAARVYSTFPRLAERRNNSGVELSGGEQQMLAIGRALLLNPKLLVMDEPTEGLAPIIVDQLAELLIQLGAEETINVLLIEQNISFACAVSSRVAIMVNGRILRVMDTGTLAGDKDLQQALLGVGRHAHDSIPDNAAGSEAAVTGGSKLERVYMSNPTLPTRWSSPVPIRQIANSARTMTRLYPLRSESDRNGRISSARIEGWIYVCGTLDTKRSELEFLRDQIKIAGHKVRMVDLSTSSGISIADVPAQAVALHHPQGASAVFTGDRGSSVMAMTLAFERWVHSREDIAGVIGAGGSGGTSMLANGFRALEIGIPKVIVSTLASGDTSAFIGTSDLILMPSIADIQGLNRISSRILGNAAAALVGMVQARQSHTHQPQSMPAIGISMFGVTTPCVKALTDLLVEQTECVVFHATDIGTRAMESLIESGWLHGVIDVSPTDVCDLIAGGVFAADERRFQAIIDAEIPYIGTCGALDMVNFRARETVPEKYNQRNLYIHNPHITLMRTTPEECEKIGEFIGHRLNQMQAPVRFFLPEGGFSMLDQEGSPFWYPEANNALFVALEKSVRQTAARQLIRVPNHVNDAKFAELLAETHISLSSQTLPLMMRN